MKKTVSLMVLSALTGAGIADGYRRAYYWLQDLRIDAARMRDVDLAFEDASDVFYEDEAEDIDYATEDDDEV